jgi:hypothetical protein
MIAMPDTLTPREHPATFPVYEYVTPLVEALDGKPIPAEVTTFLRAYNRFELEAYLKKIGEGEVRESVMKAHDLFDDFRVEERKDGILRTIHRIQPGVEIASYPFYFIYAGRSTSAKSIAGTACAVNLGYFAPLETSRGYERAQVLEDIQSACIHEGVHVYLNQLKRGWKYSDLPSILRIVWEDGLASYIEPTHHPDTVRYYDDRRFWLDVLRRWIQASTNKEKEKLIGDCLGNKRLRDVAPGTILLAQKGLEQGNDLDELFTAIMFRKNGPAYHVGRYLWEREIGQGHSLPVLVMQGSDSVRDWIVDG